MASARTSSFTPRPGSETSATYTAMPMRSPGGTPNTCPSTAFSTRSSVTPHDAARARAARPCRVIGWSRSVAFAGGASSSSLSSGRSRAASCRTAASDVARISSGENAFARAIVSARIATRSTWAQRSRPTRARTRSQYGATLVRLHGLLTVKMGSLAMLSSGPRGTPERGWRRRTEASPCARRSVSRAPVTSTSGRDRSCGRRREGRSSVARLLVRGPVVAPLVPLVVGRPLLVVCRPLAGRRRGGLVLGLVEVLEHRLADPDVVAVARAGAPEQLGEAHAFEVALQVGDRACVARVEARHQPLGLATGDPPAAVDRLDPDRVGGHGRRPGGHRGQLGTLGQQREQRLADVVHALTLERRGRNDRQSGGRQGVLGLGDLVGRREVDLVQHDQAGKLQQRRVVRPDLGPERLQRGGRILGDVQHPDQQARPADVPQELEAEALAFAGALDDAGHVGQGETVVTPAAALDHAQVGRERRERIVGDLGTRVRDRGQQAGLAGVRVAHQARVGDRPQLEAQTAQSALAAVLREARRAAGGRREAGVAAAALAARRDDGGGARLEQVGDDLAAVQIPGDGPHRHVEDQVVPALAGLLPALALLTGAAAVALAGNQSGQRPHVVDRAEHHRAAVPAVSPVRTALGDVLEAQERHRAVAAASPLYRDVDHVPERHGSLSCTSGATVTVAPDARFELSRQSADSASVAASSIDTKRPRLPLSWKRTKPVFSANSVKSLPVPTVCPGWKRGPRWRTRMLPAETS